MAMDRYTIIKGWCIFLPLMVLLFTSCGKWKGPEEEIIFSVYPVVELKATELNGDNLSDFGVFSALEENGIPFSNTEADLSEYMTNVPVTKEGTLWCANPKYYWPVLPGKKLSFFAYAPHNGSHPEIVPSADWVTSKGITIQYTPNSNPSKQIDLCVSKAVLDQDRESGSIPFDFEHTLSWISFSANYRGDVPEGCYLRIDELTLSNVVDENTLVYSSSSDDDFFWWETIGKDASKDGSYTLTLSSTMLGDIALKKWEESDPQYTNFVSASGNLYLIPQSINPDGASEKSIINIVFSYVREDQNRTVIAQFNARKELPASEWGVAKKVRYHFTVDVNNVSLVNIFKAESSEWIVDWVDSGNEYGNTEIK